MAPTSPLEPAILFRHPLAAAVVAELAEAGFQAASIDAMIARAGSSRAEFDRFFDDKEDAATRVFEAYAENFKERAGRAFAAESTWPDNLRAAAYETARWILDHPHGTRFGMVSSLEAGERPRLVREGTFRWCAGLIEQGREVAPNPVAVPEGAALMAVGAIVEILARTTQGTLEADTVAMVAPMMYGAVRPYLGEEVARAELVIPPPADLLPAGPGS